MDNNLQEQNENLEIKEIFLGIKFPILTKIQPFFNKSTKINNDPIIIFDVDDTLYNFTDTIREHYFKYLDIFTKEKGMAEDGLIRSRKYYKEYGHECIGLLKHHRIKPNEYFKNVDEKAFSHYIPKIDDKLIQILSDIPYKMYCFTNGNHNSVVNVLKEEKLIHFFEEIFHPDYESEEIIIKPKTKAFEFVENHLNTAPENIYFFDDNKVNVKVALERGWNAYLCNASLLKETVEFVLKNIKK